MATITQVEICLDAGPLRHGHNNEQEGEPMSRVYFSVLAILSLCACVCVSTSVCDSVCVWVCVPHCVPTGLGLPCLDHRCV